jgi:putative glutathione S-transferase
MTKKTAKVVSNDPAQMLLMLDFHAERLASNPEAPRATPSLYPPELREEIEAVNKVVFPGINNGVYCCWFGGQDTSPAFMEGFALVQHALQWLEDVLARNRQDSKPGPYFLGTEHPTLADVRAFPHLFRFDTIYAELMLHGRGKRIFQGDFPLLAGWIRDSMFGLPEIHRTCDLQLATRFYLTSLPVEESDAIYDKEREASGWWLPTREQWATKRYDEGMIPEQAHPAPVLV